jgi:6-phosphogluconolactonase (cycloisomerase 2 family)
LKNRIVIAASACGLSLILLLLTGCGEGFLRGASSSSATGSGGNALPVPVGPSGGSGGGGGGGGGTGSGNEFLYTVENFGGSSHVAGYRISSNTGALSNVFTTTVNNQNANDIVVDSGSQFLFVGTSQVFLLGGGGCCVFPVPAPEVQSSAIQSDGTLRAGATVNLPNTNDTLNSLLVDDKANNLYASSEALLSEGSISSFSVSHPSGSMTSMGPDKTTTFPPFRLLMHPNQLFVYSSNNARHAANSPGGWDLLRRDPTTGALTDTNQTFIGKQQGELYYDGAFVRGGEFLVGASPDRLFFTVWAVNPGTGALTVVNELPADSSSSVAADRTGNWVFFTYSTGVVQSYRVNADGSLTLAGSATGAADRPGVAMNVIVDPGNHFVYVSNPTTSQVFAFTFDATSGALGLVPGSPFATEAPPGRMAVAAK